MKSYLNLTFLKFKKQNYINCSSNLQKRIIKDFLAKIFLIFIALTILVPLILIIYAIIKKGLIEVIIFSNKNHKLILKYIPLIFNSLTGTIILIFISTFFALPLGIATGILLNEIKNKFTEILRIAINVLQGLPSIILGIIGYLWIVKPLYQFSALAGGFSLGLMMLPIIIKSTEETLKMLPYTLREASYSLGTSYSTTIIKVLIPASFPGIFTGLLLSIARISGETAPLIFTAFGNSFFNINIFKPINSLSILIYNYSMSPFAEWHTIAWFSSFLLIMFVFSINLISKIVRKKWEK